MSNFVLNSDSRGGQQKCTCSQYLKHDMRKQILYTPQLIQINIEIHQFIHSLLYVALFSLLLLFSSLLIILTMQISQLSSQCIYCNNCIDKNNDLYCDKCCNNILSHIQHCKEEQIFLNNFIQANLDNSANQDNQQENKILDILQKQQQELLKQLDRLSKANIEDQQSIISNFQNNQTELYKSNHKSLQLAEKLCIEQRKNIKLTDQYQRLLRTKVLQNFYQIQIQKKNHQCYLNGQKIKYYNLELVLPLISYILREASLKNYERKCISEIYIDQGVMLVSNSKIGTKKRDKQISIQQNGQEWISFVIQQFNNLAVSLKIQNIIPFKKLQRDTQKQCIYKLCTNLKFLMQMIDQSYSKK